MTSLQKIRERPEFESVELDVSVDEANRHIEDVVAGLTTAESPEGVKFRTRGGTLVAIVGQRFSGSGDVKAELAYRTNPASELATRKATRIYETLEPYSLHG